MEMDVRCSFDVCARSLQPFEWLSNKKDLGEKRLMPGFGLQSTAGFPCPSVNRADCNASERRHFGVPEIPGLEEYQSYDPILEMLSGAEEHQAAEVF